MEDCPNIEKCPFFDSKLAGKTGLSTIYMKNYCQDDFKKCARYKVSQSGIKVPKNLFPNMNKRAEKLVNTE